MNERQKGFTLIEMLIAIAIFSSLIGILLMGFNQGLNLWGKGQHKTEKWMLLEHRYDWLEHVFSQAVAADYYIAGKGTWPFFHGNEKEMTLITAAPVMDTPGSLRPVQLRLFEEDGKYTLKYREGRKSATVKMDISFKSATWIPLFQDLKKASFQYEAPVNPFPLDMPENMLPADMRKRYRNTPEWMSVFDSRSIVSLPGRVDFFFIDKDGVEHRWRFHCRYVANVWSEEFYDAAKQ